MILLIPLIYSIYLFLIVYLLSCLNIIETNQYHIVCILDSWYIRMMYVWNIHHHLCSLLNVPVSYCFIFIFSPLSKKKHFHIYRHFLKLHHNFSRELYVCTSTLYSNIEWINQTNDINVYVCNATVTIFNNICLCAMLILFYVNMQKEKNRMM